MDKGDGRDGRNEDNSYKNKKEMIGEIEDIEDTGQIEEDLKEMVGGAGNYRVPDSNTEEGKLTERLLQILNTRINQIVVDFKQVLGNTNQAVNGSVATIVGVLDTLSDNINTTSTIGNNLIFGNPLQINRDTGITTPYNDAILRQGLNPGDFQEYNYNTITAINDNLNNNPQFYSNTVNNNQFENLDSNIIDPNNIDGAEIQLDANGIEQVQNRLSNCADLEHLYLVKHMELMKIFAFTINLFDKYKYAIKIVLFLLKYLVNKNKEEPDCGSIKLPPPLIPKINDLVRDQAAVQDTINLMRTQLNSNDNLNNLHQQATTKFRTNPNGTAVDDLTANVPQ
jgi:hypothetical protein